MAPEEVDLTSATPPKKMKQARLPFAPRPTNKPTTAPSPALAPGNDMRSEILGSPCRVLSSLS